MIEQIGPMGEERLLLGILYAALGAFTFALNNVAMRRGVVTGGMAMTVPIGGFSFLVMTVAFGELSQLVVFPSGALAWLAGQGIVHFVLGRYSNYKSNQLMGVNLAAPVVQLQVPFAMMLAVAMLHEKFTMLQVIGSVLMLGGSLVTQSKTKKTSAALPGPTPFGAVPSQQKQAAPGPAFRPRVLLGLSLRPRRGDVLWQLTADGPPGLPERARCRHRGRGLPRLCGGDAVILADPAQARLLGRNQGYEQ